MSEIVRYPRRVRYLHWGMAFLILAMIAAGWTMVRLGDGVLAKFELLYPYHKSFGMVVLFLALARLVIRRQARLPALPDQLKTWEKKLAKVAHVALYVLMIAVPLMGYAMSSSFAEGDGVYFFGVNLPELVPDSEAGFDAFNTLHRILAYTLLGLVALHALGALKHRFLSHDRREDVLSRML